MIKDRYCTYCLHWNGKMVASNTTGMAVPKFEDAELQKHLKKMSKIGSRQIHYGKKLIEYDRCRIR